mgnify:CR=1 FL=1
MGWLACYGHLPCSPLPHTCSHTNTQTRTRLTRPPGPHARPTLPTPTPPAPPTRQVLFDAVRLMHVSRPARLVVAAYGAAAAPQLTSKGRRAKDVLCGAVQEVVALLDLLLQPVWQARWQALAAAGGPAGGGWRGCWAGCGWGGGVVGGGGGKLGRVGTGLWGRGGAEQREQERAWCAAGEAVREGEECQVCPPAADALPQRTSQGRVSHQHESPDLYMQQD